MTRRDRRRGVSTTPVQELDQVLAAFQSELRRIAMHAARTVVIETLRTARSIRDRSGRGQAGDRPAPSRPRRIAALAPPPSRPSKVRWTSTSQQWTEATTLVTTHAATPSDTEPPAVSSGGDPEAPGHDDRGPE